MKIVGLGSSRREVSLEKREEGSELILFLFKSQTNEMDENEKEVDEMREMRNERYLSFVRSSKSPGGSDLMLLEKRRRG